MSRVLQLVESWERSTRGASGQLMPMARRMLLGAEPSGRHFTAEERREIESLDSDDRPEPIDESGLVAIIKATRLCNLRCTYCHSWRSGPGQVMSTATMAKVIRDSLWSTRGPVDFVWHGGEVTTLPTSVIHKAIWLQERWRGENQLVSNSLQTNAFRLTDDWIDCVAAFGVSVGVSLDGPPELHDRVRLTAGGKPTSASIARNLARLRAKGIQFGLLMVVTRKTIALGARHLLDYAGGCGCVSIALLNVIPGNGPDQIDSDEYLDQRAFSAFLIDVFDLWWREYRDEFEVRELQSLVDAVAKGRPSLCVHAGNCMGGYLTFDPDGAITACDKYIESPAHRFGTIAELTVEQVRRASDRLANAREEADEDLSAFSRCRHAHICSGGCPHDAYVSRRRGLDHSGCCGLSQLIDHIESTLHSERMVTWHRKSR